MAARDTDLIRRIAKGDADAFETLHARYEQPIRRHLLRMVRDPAAAEDLLQETFVRVWTRAETWDEHGSPQAWLFRIATNVALNHFRSERRRKTRPLEVHTDVADEEAEAAAPGWLIDASSLGPEALAEQIEQHRLLWQLVDELPEAKREVMRLIYDAEMDIQEAAEALGIPEGTVKSRLHHARRQLAREWRQIDSEDEDQCQEGNKE